MKIYYVLGMMLMLAGCATRAERYQPEDEKDRSPERYQEQYVH